jgi:hypothetical protein
MQIFRRGPNRLLRPRPRTPLGAALNVRNADKITFGTWVPTLWTTYVNSAHIVLGSSPGNLVILTNNLVICLPGCSAWTDGRLQTKCLDSVWTLPPDRPLTVSAPNTEGPWRQYLYRKVQL